MSKLYIILKFSFTPVVETSFHYGAGKMWFETIFFRFFGSFWRTRRAR